MLVFHKLEEVPAGCGPSVVSVGNFDGVHRAHGRVLCELVKRAAARNAKSVAVTFEPHPVRILRSDAPLKLITPTAEKLLLLEKSGIDSVLVLPFTRDMSLLSAHNFARQILRDCLGTIEVHEGYNFRFGHKAAGDVKLLTDLGRELNFEVPDDWEDKSISASIRASKPRQAAAGEALQYCFNAGPRPWLRLEVHGTHYQPEPIRRTRPC